MKIKTPHGINRILGAILIFFCFFSNLFPFLNIDLKIIILTPQRMVPLLISIWCLVIWGKRVYHRQLAGELKKRKFELIVFAFLCVWFICGAAWMVLGEMNELVSAEVMGILSICLYGFCLFTLTEDNDDLHFLLKVTLVCGMVMAILADIEIVVGSFVEGARYHYTLQERISLGRSLFPPSVVFHNTNDFAAFTLACLSLVAFRFINARTKKEYVECIVIALLLLSPIPVINSTIFDLAFLVLLSVTLVFAGLCRDHSGMKKLIKCAGSALFALVYLLPFSALARAIGKGMNTAYFTARARAYLMQTSTMPTEGTGTTIPVPEIDNPFVDNDAGMSDTLASQITAAQAGYGTIHIRTWLIRAGLDFFTQSPLVGFGPGGFQVKMGESYDYREQTRGIVDPHNFYIELLVQYGGVMFLAYAAIVFYMLIAAFKKALRELKAGKAGNGVLTILLLGAFSITALMPSGFIRLTAMWPFFLLAVLAFSHRNEQQDERT